jgi:Family of unknown function (DUF6541)
MRSVLIISLLICIGLIILVALTGAADAIDPANVQDNAAIPAGDLTGAHTIGQTFVFHHPRLDAIELRWIVSPDLDYAGDSRIILHLRQRPQDSADLATASIALGEIRNNDFAKFSFPLIQNSETQSFYFFVDASQAKITRGYISVWASAGDDYPSGQMYVDGTAKNGDLAFRAYYQPDLTFVLHSLQNESTRYLWVSAVLVSVALIVGLAFFLLFQIRGELYLIETVALTSGLGLAALSALSFALLLLRAPTWWLIAGIAAASLVVLIVGGREVFRARSMLANRVRHPRPISWCLAALTLLSIAVAFLQIHDTAVPLWKDSPTHAQEISTILAQGLLPTNFFYHFGFHSIAALIIQLSGASIPVVMLLFGQLLIVQTGLSMFLLTERLTRSEIAALVSAVCIWFLFPTPAYLITWGRYPLLLGAALLPIALVFAIDLIEKPGVSRAILAAMVFGGLAFAHARLAVCYLVFVTIYLAYRVWRGRRAARPWIALAVAPFVLLIAMRAVAQWAGWAGRLHAGEDLVTLSTATDISLTHHGPLLLALAAIAVIVAFVQRQRGALLALAWFGALAGVSLIAAKYLPLPFIVLIGFMPVSLLVGALIDFLYTKTAARTKPAAVLWSATLFIVSVLGARDMISVINPATILFTSADQNALSWIEQRTPRDAKFLVNSDVWFGPDFSPSDGGVWIPFVAGRAIDYVTSPAVTESADVETLARWVDAHQIDFIYLSTKAGVLRENDFACVPDRYTRVYDQDGITIFQVQHTAPTRLSPRAGCARAYSQ